VPATAANRARVAAKQGSTHGGTAREWQSPLQKEHRQATCVCGGGGSRWCWDWVGTAQRRWDLRGARPAGAGKAMGNWGSEKHAPTVGLHSIEREREGSGHWHVGQKECRSDRVDRMERVGCGSGPLR
jgi:hypothetical protein